MLIVFKYLKCWQVWKEAQSFLFYLAEIAEGSGDCREKNFCFGIIMTLLRYRKCPVVEHMELEVVSFLFLEVFNQKLVDSWLWTRVGGGTLVVCVCLCGDVGTVQVSQREKDQSKLELESHFKLGIEMLQRAEEQPQSCSNGLWARS